MGSSVTNLVEFLHSTTINTTNFKMKSFVIYAACIAMVFGAPAPEAEAEAEATPEAVADPEAWYGGLGIGGIGLGAGIGHGIGGIGIGAGIGHGVVAAPAPRVIAAPVTRVISAPIIRRVISAPIVTRRSVVSATVIATHRTILPAAAAPIGLGIGAGLGGGLVGGQIW